MKVVGYDKKSPPGTLYDPAQDNYREKSERGKQDYPCRHKERAKDKTLSGAMVVQEDVTPGPSKYQSYLEGYPGSTDLQGREPSDRKDQRIEEQQSHGSVGSQCRHKANEKFCRDLLQ